MPRRNNSDMRGHTVQSGKERRSIRILQAYRMLDAESSSLLAGVVLSLERDNSIPRLRAVPTAHQVRILDPHLVKKEFSHGMRTGMRIAGAIDGCVREAKKSRQCITEAKISQLSIPTGSNGHRRTIIASVEHPAVVHDRVALYTELGKKGLHGFNQRVESPGAPTFVVGTFTESLSHSDAEAIAEVIDTGLLVNNGLAVGMGKLQIVTDKPLLD
ncbi:MAG TPA: hypothetical protein VFN56_02620 [Candidatus Saccharimonadales bacterium]|nr:hypothetical protein [Candidatus Saccharimonadales bacterium]